MLRLYLLVVIYLICFPKSPWTGIAFNNKILSNPNGCYVRAMKNLKSCSQLRNNPKNWNLNKQSYQIWNDNNRYQIQERLMHSEALTVECLIIGFVYLSEQRGSSHHCPRRPMFVISTGTGHVSHSSRDFKYEGMVFSLGGDMDWLQR